MAYIMPNSRFFSTLAQYFQQLTQKVSRSLENDALRAETRCCLGKKLGFLLTAVYFVGKATPLQVWTGP
jgi:hypothetical protein